MKPYVFVGALLTVCLSACVSQSPHETETASPPVTSTFGATFTPPRRTPTRTPTRFRPTQTPRPTETPSFVYGELPTPPGAVEDPGDRLSTPSPEALLGLIDWVNKQYGMAQRSGSDDPTSNGPTFDDLYALRDVVGHEIGRHYPGGLPDPALVFSMPLTSDWFAFYPAQYAQLLSNGAFQLIAARGQELADGRELSLGVFGATARVYTVELDHDARAEWLLHVHWSDIGAVTWLALDDDEAGELRRLENELPDLVNAYGDDSFALLEDFTGDGLTDVIEVDARYMMGTDFGTFYVAQGTPQGFVLRQSIHQSIGGYLSDGLQYEVIRPDGADLATFAVSDPHDLNWGCYWNTVTTYRWPNGQPRQTVTGESAPNTAECALAKAVAVGSDLNYEAAISLLESSISRLDASDPAQAPKALFARYRLAILDALVGRSTAARTHWTWFVEHYTGSQTFKQNVLQPILERNDLNGLELCSLFTNELDALPEEWVGFVNATAALNAYPASWDVYPPAVCPLPDLLYERLTRIPKGIVGSPEDALRAAGLEPTEVREYRIGGNNPSAWFALVSQEPMFLVGYVPAESGYAWKLLTGFAQNDTLDTVIDGDVTNDGVPELAYVFQREDDSDCSAGLSGYRVFVSTLSSAGVVSMGQDFCVTVDQAKDADTFLADQDFDGRVDWVQERLEAQYGASNLTADRSGPVTWFSPEEVMSMARRSSEQVPDLIVQLYGGQDPGVVREQLQAELDALPISTGAAAYARQQREYLIAVSYELAGDANQAATAFRDLARSQTPTLWAYLARLHLQAK